MTLYPQTECTAWRPGHLIDDYGNSMKWCLYDHEQNCVDVADSLIYNLIRSK